MSWEGAAAGLDLCGQSVPSVSDEVRLGPSRSEAKVDEERALAAGVEVVV